MEARYQRAIKIGLICGLVIAVIYLISGLAGLWLNSTPAMVAYTDRIVESIKNNVEYPYSPTGFSDLPQPPLEYYVNMALSLIVLGVELVGLLLAGALALIYGTQAKYTSKDAVYTGAVSGLAAFAPLFAGMVIITVISSLTGQVSSIFTSALPGTVSVSPLIVMITSLISIGCCCLPAGAIVSAVLGGIGALGYALFTNRIDKQATTP